MKTTAIKSMVLIGLLLIFLLINSCMTRHPRCMKNYYKDVQMGLAH
jgi:hypothetical protein